MRGPYLLAIALGASACAPPGSADGLRVLAASSLTDVYEELSDAFEAANPGVDVQLQFAGSSRLASLIEEGAPGDVFASADLRTMQRAVDSGETTSDPLVFATNSLTLVAPRDNPASITGLDDLAARDVLVAQCAVEVPCGAAAVELFASRDVVVDADSLEPNVRAVLTKVELGEVDVGVVYTTDALAAGDRVTELPIDADRVANEYSIATLTEASGAADRFVSFVASPEGRAILSAHGFGTP